MNQQINDLIEQANTANTRTGKFKLEPEIEAELDAFVDWLISQNRSEGGARSYRSYVAKALFLKLDWTDMDSDIRSGVRKFAEYVGQRDEA